MIGKRTAIAGRTLAWIVFGGAAFACFWIMVSSAIYLSLEGRWGDPRIRAFERPVVWALRVAQGGRDLTEVLNLIIAGLAPLAPTLALVRWQWRRLGGLIGITRRATGFDRIRRGTTLNHGVADWMSLDEAAQLFPFEPDPEVGGVVVGELERVDLGPVARMRFDPQRKETWGNGGSAPLMIDPCRSGTTHSIVIAGGGGYKSTTLVTSLLTWRKSMFVLDPSCELASLTGEAIEASGRRVIRLTIGSEGLNVLAGIDVNDALGETRLRSVISRVIGPMPKEGDGGNSVRFKRWGRTILTALAADLVWRTDIDPSLKTLRTLRDGVAVPESRLRARLRGIFENSPSPLARSLAGSTMEFAPEQFSGAHGNATDDTEWLASEKYGDLVSGSAFHLPDIVNGDLAVFVQLPLEALLSSPAVARVLVGCALDAVFAANGHVNGRVYFPLDEAVLLGPEPSLKVARDQGRKSKITLQLFYQSEGQIEEVWGKPGKQAWFDGVSWRQYAGIQNLETAKDVSASLGTFAAMATSRGENTGRSSRILELPSMSSGSGINEHEISREVAKPHELMQEMRPDERITLPRGERPIRHGAAIGFRRPEIALQLGETNYGPVRPFTNGAPAVAPPPQARVAAEAPTLLPP